MVNTFFRDYTTDNGQRTTVYFLFNIWGIESGLKTTSQRDYETTSAFFL